MRRLAAALLLAAFCAAEARAASTYLPRLRFRVLITPHFRIYYHQGGEPLARELAAIAEEVHRGLPADLGLPAPGTVHVVIADQDDASNGSAIPLPYNTITLAAAWPAQSELIGFTRDWLRLVFVHEYAHILQVAQSRGWATVMHAIFGRSPLAFPNLALPLWQIEGFATWVESRETGEGRVRAGDAATIVRERVRRAGPEPLDRYNGGLDDWPGGNGPYLYGGYFHQYLVDRFGERKMGELIERQAGRVHYFGAGAYKAVLGEALGELWRDFQRDTAAAARASLAANGAPAPGAAAGPSPRRLTRHGFFVGSPRFTPDGAALVYLLQTPHRFPSVMRLGADGVPRQVATQYGSEGLTAGERSVVFDQLELDASVALRADLYAAPIGGGRARRLTGNARLLQPALSPGAASLVAVRITGGERRLAWFDVERAADGTVRGLAPRPGPADDAAQAGSPRWSPDGRLVAFERRVTGGPSQIAVIDAAGGSLRVVASSASHRLITPEWTPDGAAIVFASDEPVTGGRPVTARSFQLYAVPAAGGPARILTAAPGGAVSPALSPDGRRLVYVGYTAEGADLFEQSFDSGATAGQPAGAAAPVRVSGSTPAAEAPASVGIEPRSDEVREGAYSPLPTLLPRAWIPVAQTGDEAFKLGVATGGVDVLRRHGWDAILRWRVGSQHEAVNGLHRARPDWDVGYTYDRWRTPLFVSASDETSFLTVRTAGGARLPDAELRERKANAGLLLPVVRVRHVQLWQAAFTYERSTLDITGSPHTFRRNAVQGGWMLDSARRFGYSISQEEGQSLGVATEQVRAALGADGDAQAWTAQARLFRRLGGRHSVVAARVGAAASSGDQNVRRVFFLGGAAPSGSVLSVDSEAVEMLRGLEEEAYSGTRVVSGSLEYRFPLARVERGWHTFPLFLRAFHAAVFADAGHAWDSGFAWSDLKASAGAELAVDTVVGFGLPVTVAGGIAWARDGATGRRFDPRPYIRIGRAF
ncbi:MAG: domain protein beta Propeller [Acidobacteria bacterium]|nr:domain protein beta Propeller [Acidobacteriota bacterium]